jgi:hypothetical protein
MRLPEYVTIHEVGHNWFQGILASNEPEEAWLDEGVNEWADGNVMAKLYGERGSLLDWSDFAADVYDLRGSIMGDLRDLPSPIATAAWAFVDMETYGIATYGKTMLAMRTLENVIGRDRFDAAMKAYAKKFAFQHPTGQDLFATLREELGEDLAWFIGPAWNDIGTVELAVQTARCERNHPDRGMFGSGDARKEKTSDETKDTKSWRCEVIVKNTGTIPVPVDVELRFEDGTTQRLRWDDRTGSHWERFSFERSSQITEVEIDPDNKIALGDGFEKREYRLEPDSRAAWRAGARVGFWAQTLMSVVGL